MINKTRYPKRYLIAILFLGSVFFGFAWYSMPVIHSAEIINVRRVAEGVKFDVKFYKAKSCEFKGLSWYDKDDERHPIVWAKKEQGLPPSRPTGWQNSKNWMLIGIDDIENSYAWAHHLCFGISKNSRFYN